MNSAELPREQSELFFISMTNPYALDMAAQMLVAHLAKGRIIDTSALRAAMERDSPCATRLGW